ncbi:uncharacterized protein BO96DRAFT_480066 [Aspergillus niger CBS 101883]|uniref:uncharacterized protein n=1 Tax=Aspergillus lacticoffeatus (strain CBS 101883) TaxID=1450533 RepID=UPI000D7F4F25|nr:uncharacterized protein BO96DRAFT_480066 [Aspergillus niger CBS 101883]PYH54372.1 hypothetical protein BO96DRAFT_480066 [Aspergillus niger CBS 101883]
MAEIKMRRASISSVAVATILSADKMRIRSVLCTVFKYLRCVLSRSGSCQTVDARLWQNPSMGPTVRGNSQILQLPDKRTVRKRIPAQMPPFASLMLKVGPVEEGLTETQGTQSSAHPVLSDRPTLLRACSGLLSGH